MKTNQTGPGASALLGAIRNYDWVNYRQLFTPKLATALKAGYTSDTFRKDALAGLTVAILALPLSMAIAIGCGVTPDRGLITAVVAGTLISVLGGSRFQIGGPAAAFIVIVAQVFAQHGNAGLLAATLLAGTILVVAGLSQLGSYIKYVPGPVILGFTSGIGAVIAVGQLKDFFGLTGTVPAEFFGKIEALWHMRGTFNAPAFAIGAGSLAGIFALKYWRPQWPGLLIAVVAASAVVWVLKLPVETIGSRFGGIPSSLPFPTLPALSWGTVRDILPSSFTIAFLIGVESLLSAVAADTMARTRHRSNMEIVAQGVANIGSALFGGLPATGVIARTGTNIQAGAKTPVAGVLHALFVLAFMLLLAPLAAYLALPCLAAVLLATAWRLMEIGHVSHFLSRAPWDDRSVLAATLSLTIAVDLSVAIAVGVVLASMLFMHRMAENYTLDLAGAHMVLDDVVDGSEERSVILTQPLPDGIRVFDLRGPLFFGATARLGVALAGLGKWPKVVILRMRDVPLVDATGIDALDELIAMAEGHDCRIVISGIQKQPREAMHRYGLMRKHRVVPASNSYVAMEKAKQLLDDAVRRT
ncbi:MAG: SulP family inorganic anion transporter [Hyphomicrobium sp.]